ncbi:MAG: redoxin domain-containing protein [bacterium]|nr:redoxin domain-containing protein [bacterium]
MIQAETDKIKRLPKKERLKFFREQQAKQRQSQQRKGLIVKAVIVLAAVATIIFFGYLVVNSSPSGQNVSSSNMTSLGNLKLGDQAPDFTLPATNGSTVSLSQYKGKNVLLYFQEGVMCQPCWKQIGTMQKNSDKFKAVETEVIAIGVDTTADWGPILRAEGITTIPVLVDFDRKVSKAYGVLSLPSQMHSDRPGHTFVLVDKNGKIAWIADYPTMRSTEQEILDYIKKALGGDS